MKQSVRIDVAEFAREMELDVANLGRGSFEAGTSDINRPAMQFAGYFEHFASERIQLLGHQEMGYMSELDPMLLNRRFREFFSYPVPLIIICNGADLHEGMMYHARAKDIPVLMGKRSASTIVHRVVSFLDEALAPEIAVHGNLVEVYNVGVLIRAESGMGKSELTLELISRGHRMVSDDMVLLRRTGDNTLMGFAPEATRNLMEIRGLGIIDVRRFYGMSSVLERKTVQVIIDMEMWQAGVNYDRLGFDQQFEKVLDVPLAHYVMPVRPGRNLAVVVEMTAMDFRVKTMGLDMEKEIEDKLSGVFSAKEK